jgi:hypothetical protein
VIILYPYVDSDDPRYEASRAFVRSYEEHSIMKLRIIGEHDYPLFIMRHWGHENMVIIEHDIVPTSRQMQLMFNLLIMNDLVAFRYSLYPSATGLETPVCVHRVKDDSKCGWHWLEDDEEYADYAGFGFTGFSVEAQRSLRYPLFPPNQGWNSCDTQVSLRFIRQEMKFYVPLGEWVRHDHQ